ALTERSRRPVCYANQAPRQIERLIIASKRDKPHWGARKIRELLVRRLDGRHPRSGQEHDLRRAPSTPPRPGQDPTQLRRRATSAPLSTGTAPNDLCYADCKSLPPQRRGASSSSAMADTALR